ncbi:MAG: hypothetical protein JWO97_2660 [Acidobacteria bacterium]|nr:hypothetical protein [Acidobacteriota bacterium]
MARYIQKISLLGKERWIGWEVDGVGTEMPGLTLADDLPEEDLRTRGVKEFLPMPFESFLGMTAAIADGRAQLDQDVEFRLDALQVGMERFRSRGVTDVPKSLLADVFGGDDPLQHPRVQERFREWEKKGAVDVVLRDDCYLRIRGRLA